MGERIKDLAMVNIGNTKFRIELNAAYSANCRYDIHLQCDKGRIGLTDREFLKLATCFAVARKQLEQYKEINGHE